MSCRNDSRAHFLGKVEVDLSVNRNNNAKLQNICCQANCADYVTELRELQDPVPVPIPSPSPRVHGP